MLWIKRNLFLVVGGVMALGLLGLGGYYFWTSYEDNKAVEGKLEESKADLKRLSDLTPAASKDNIDKAKTEVEKLKSAIAQTKLSFTPLPYEKVKGQAFKTNLDTAIDELLKRAERASVALPAPKYAFTFAEQQKRLQFSEGSFPTLSEQLAEIKAICNILFASKINKLTALHRGRVTLDDPPGAADYHELKPERTLASGAVVSPYLAEFNCFSSELATAMEGFYKSPHGLLVKSVEVKPMDEAPAGPGTPVPNPVTGTPAPGVAPVRRPLPTTLGTPVPAAAPRPPPRPRPRQPGSPADTVPLTGEGMKTVLDEKMLHITLWVDVLKPPTK